MLKRVEVAAGVSLSEIALGAGKRGDPEFERETFAIMDRYTELGGNTFDTARVYGGGLCDIALGKWIAERGNRADIVLVTKGNHPDREDMFTSRLSGEEIAFDLDASLAAIGTEYTDLHLLHRDDVKRPVADIVLALDGLVRAGKARAVGVSNWTVARIAEANDFARANGLAPLSCCQLHYSLAQTTAAATGDLTHVPMNDVEGTWYRETRLPVMAFSVQARGWFALRARGEAPKDSPMRYYDRFPENHRRLERLRQLSAETGRSMAAITTAYVRDAGLNAVPLCAYSSIAQMEESFAALEFVLTEEQVRFLERG